PRAPAAAPAPTPAPGCSSATAQDRPPARARASPPIRTKAPSSRAPPHPRPRPPAPPRRGTPDSAASYRAPPAVYRALPGTALALRHPAPQAGDDPGGLATGQESHAVHLGRAPHEGQQAAILQPVPAQGEGQPLDLRPLPRGGPRPALPAARRGAGDADVRAAALELPAPGEQLLIREVTQARMPGKSGLRRAPRLLIHPQLRRRLVRQRQQYPTALVHHVTAPVRPSPPPAPGRPASPPVHCRARPPMPARAHSAASMRS